MATTGAVGVDEPSGTPDKEAAVYTITEDALTKFLQRIVMSTGAGVELAYGSGALGTNVPRVVHATDDPVIAAITGNVADGGADSGNSSKIAGIGRAGLATATLFAAGNRVPQAMELDGAMIMRKVPLEDIVIGNASNTDGTVTSVITAAGSGIKQYLTAVSLINMHATTVTYVELKSGTTVMWRLPCPPGGAIVTFAEPLPPNAANEAWSFDPAAAVTTLYCSMIGFKSKI